MSKGKPITFRSGLITLEQFMSFTHPNHSRAFEAGVPYPLNLRFTNEFQIAALIARVPHDQAVNFNNLQQILDYFNNAAQENLHEAIGRLVVYINGKMIFNRIAEDQLTPFIELQIQLTQMIQVHDQPDNANNTSTLMPTAAAAAAPTDIHNIESDMSGAIVSIFEHGCGFYK